VRDQHEHCRSSLAPRLSAPSDRRWHCELDAEVSSSSCVHRLKCSNREFACSWPRGIVLGSDDGDTNELKQSYFYSEYTGRISRGATQAVIVNAVSAPAMQYLDNLVQQSSAQGGGDHSYFYALE
jgi:hypothetical protein